MQTRQEGEVCCFSRIFAWSSENSHDYANWSKGLKLLQSSTSVSHSHAKISHDHVKWDKLIVLHFQSYENSLVFAWIPLFCMNLPTGDGPLKLFFFFLRHAFHPSEKSFKTQIKDLRWAYLMETKRKIKIKIIKIQRKVEKWETIGLASHLHD